MCASIQTKQTTLTLWAQIYPKMDFGVAISKIYVWIRIQLLQDIIYANFQSKWMTLNFSA